MRAWPELVIMKLTLACAVAGATVVAGSTAVLPRQADLVALVRLPDGGIQPQAVADLDGSTHVVYFKGEPAAGDLFYARLAVDGTWSQPLRVNSTPALIS